MLRISAVMLMALMTTSCCLLRSEVETVSDFCGMAEPIYVLPEERDLLPKSLKNNIKAHNAIYEKYCL